MRQPNSGVSRENTASSLLHAQHPDRRRKKVSNFKFVLIKLSMCCCHHWSRFDGILFCCDLKHFFFVLFLHSLCLSYGEATTAAYRPWNVAIRRFIRFDTMRTCVLRTAYQRIQKQIEIFSYLHVPTVNIEFVVRRVQTRIVGNVETTLKLRVGHGHCEANTTYCADTSAGPTHTEAKYAIWIDINNLLFCDLFESAARRIIRSSPSIVCLFSPANGRNEIKQMSVCHFSPKLNKYQLLQVCVAYTHRTKRFPTTKQCAH